MTAIAVVDLAVTLDRAPVLRGVSCEAASGGWLALIGPNGAGKSTLIRAAAGLLPYQGTVLIGGADAATLSARDRARLVAYVPQEPVLPPDMTVAQYVLLGRTPYVGYLGAPGAGPGPGRRRPRAARRRAVRAAPAGPDVRRRTAAGGAGPGAGQRAERAAARRADVDAGRRPPAAGARAGRRAAPGRGPDRAVDAARPHRGRASTRTRWCCSTRAGWWRPGRRRRC